MTEIDSGIDLRALRALVAIADGGSFSGAAAPLGYSQSAISHLIAALERAVGASLLNRPGERGAVSLTPAGQAAYAHARRALAAVEALEGDVGPDGGPGRTRAPVGGV